VQKFGSTVASLSREFDGYKITFKTDDSNTTTRKVTTIAVIPFLCISMKLPSVAETFLNH
jgi:hypothetical protein